MRYMGGKFRQSKAIVEVLRPYITPDTIYVEPFCGGMWSAARVARELKPKEIILNDINKPLMLLWEKCLKEGCDWLPIDSNEIESNYRRYWNTRDENDPLTAWYGIACSFGGKWFGAIARNKRDTPNGDYSPQLRSTQKKSQSIAMCNPTLMNNDYKNIEIPDGAVVYCDPPYEGREKVHHFDKFDYDEFWQWVRDLSKRCIVFTSCFDCPSDFETVYSWGDTVVRYLNSKGTDGTSEKLVKYKGGEIMDCPYYEPDYCEIRDCEECEYRLEMEEED